MTSPSCLPIEGARAMYGESERRKKLCQRVCFILKVYVWHVFTLYMFAETHGGILHSRVLMLSLVLGPVY